MSAVELCAGGGGQALGIERSGFECAAAVEIEQIACDTLRNNRPHWNVIAGDIRGIDGKDFDGVDLIAGGVPCPPFSVAGRQLGPDDERDLFPEAVRIISEARPKALMLENVAGFASSRFEGYRRDLFWQLARLGYQAEGRLLNASNFGVPQLRPRFIIVGFLGCTMDRFTWPSEVKCTTTVGDALLDLMMERGWPGALKWSARACGTAPTIVGGSRKHGGPDLGPTRARAQWKELGVDGLGIANEAPGPDFPEEGLPRLTTQMVARLQGFPDTWAFAGKKTAAYRQVGNAFPPPVAHAVSSRIRAALQGEATLTYRQTSDGQLHVFEPKGNPWAQETN